MDWLDTGWQFNGTFSLAAETATAEVGTDHDLQIKDRDLDCDLDRDLDRDLDHLREVCKDLDQFYGDLGQRS